MAMLGSALMGLMSHSDAEKMFRPWWDAIEDFVIYGLIMLGLIVSPTTTFNGTPPVLHRLHTGIVYIARLYIYKYIVYKATVGLGIVDFCTPIKFQYQFYR